MNLYKFIYNLDFEPIGAEYTPAELILLFPTYFFNQSIKLYQPIKDNAGKLTIPLFEGM